MGEKASGYEKVTRNMVENLEKAMDRGFKDIDRRLKSMEDSYNEMFNHQSNRLPLWATIFFTVGGSILSGLIIWIVTH